MFSGTRSAGEWDAEHNCEEGIDHNDASVVPQDLNSNLSTTVIAPTSSAGPLPSVQAKKRARTSAEKTTNFADKHRTLDIPKQCKDGCRNQCFLKVSEASRVQINTEVNHLDRETRLQWYRTYVELKDIHVRRPEHKRETDPRRARAFTWTLPTPGSKAVTVCRAFFLATLGFAPENSFAVLSAVTNGEIRAKEDARGRHQSLNKVDITAEVRDHVDRYHPMKHHYRYEHAPHRMYLPSDITVREMHKNFTDSGGQCSYETYRKIVRDMNISFTQLAGEECSKCSIQIQHLNDCHGVKVREPSHHIEECPQCSAHLSHMGMANIARCEYRADADREWRKDELIVSADMMKITVVPILPVKEAVFTSRLICYNETFSVLMPESKTRKAERRTVQKERSLCVLWHEAQAGRNAEDVAAAFVLYLESVCRDVAHVTIWADNCSAQNKSWMLLSALLKVVHSTKTVTERITVKFLETGHTAMSADAVHQKISKNMKHKK